jgi:DOPA 4,5-dioxygenase
MILHAHVYYSLEQKLIAQAFHEELVHEFEGKIIKISELNDGPLGPHPLPTFELHFDSGLRDQVVSFIKTNRKGLSVLIHEDTNDDHRDHRDNIEWLGEPIELDFGFFDRILLNPELRINK